MAIKTLLRKVFPVALLNKGYLIYNDLRINTIDKLLFPEKLIYKQEFLIQQDLYPFAATFTDAAHLERRLQHQVAVWQNWTQDEYLLIYEKPCLLEPNAGWALSTDNKLIYPSLGFSRVPYLRKPSVWALRMRNKPVEEYAELISLRDTGEENYFHFYNDVLAKLFFLEEKLTISQQIPILISAALYHKPVFQYFLQNSYLRNRTWVVQDKQYVRSQKTYFCKPLTHTQQYYERIRSMARSEDVVVTKAERRIFITRNPKRLRFVENSAEIEQLCRELGFEIVDFDIVSLPEQIQLLANTRYVIGIHGAGLVNMLFRGKQPLGLLEIFPPGEYYPFHYMMMAAQLGYAYEGQIGEIGRKPNSSGFYVDPAELRRRITALLTSE